jgi:GT2 family glycosyltransferase
MFDVSVVIVNFNLKEEIDRCLASLYADIKQSPLVVKIIVVDNASTDDSVAFLRTKYPDVHFNVQLSNVGFGKAQNIGLKLFPAKYYLILNPDTYFFPGQNILQRMYDFMEQNQKIGLMGPKTLNLDGSIQYSCCRFPTLWQPLFSRTKFGLKGKGKKLTERLLMKDFDHESTRPVDWVIGSIMFVRGEALTKVGMFDERFWMYYEDSDLCRRFWEAHLPVYYVHSIVLEHAHHRVSAQVPGFIALIKNKYARVHTISWLKYMWKWRGNYKYYA